MSHWEIEPVEGMANQWLDCDQDKLLRLMLRKIQEANIDTNDINILTPVDANKTAGWITQELKMSCPEQKQRYLYTVIPINFSNSHWITVVIHHNHHDSSQPKVYLFDPLGLHDDKMEVLTSILKNTRVYTNPNMINLLSAEEKPLQEDDYTCGTWMLESVNRIIAGLNDNLGINDIKESIQNISSLDLKDIHEQNLKAPELQ